MSYDIHHLAKDLERIISEGRNPNTLDIDTLSTQAILARINHEDAKVAPAVASELPSIAMAVNAATKSIRNNGRLVYLGAGTSGRLGILDAAECRPTFSVPDGVVVGIIAGGERAILHAVEGAEDNQNAGKYDLEKINLSSKDTLVGLSASGRTPYVSGGLQYAQSLGCTTVAVACNKNAAIFQHADITICPIVGPEVLTGSTRMKSGSAQKMVLNMISTATMIQLGKTFENLMVDVNATNRKLQARALRIVMQATDCNEDVALDALNKANYNVKVAILMLLANMSAAEAHQQLAHHSGYLRNALKTE